MCQCDRAGHELYDCESQKCMLDPLEVELFEVVNHYVGGGN